MGKDGPLDIRNAVCFIFVFLIDLFLFSRNTGYREYEQEDSLSFLTTVLNGLDEEYEKSKIGLSLSSVRS